MHTVDEVDELLKARAEIDERLRRHKNALTVLFTDVVGSTSYFERNGDTAGLVMIHRHDELAASAIQQHDGKVVKTIGDSAMAEFPDPTSAVFAAVEIQRQFLKLNSSLPQDQRVEVRIGVHTGVGFRKGNDLFGDVVNVAARIVKRTAPAQILVSRPMHEAIADDPDLICHWLDKLTLDGRTEKEDIFEVVWTGVSVYRDLQERVAASTQVPARYEALSQIGTGGTGIVYKVRDLETNEIVALKVLKPEIASDPEVQENLIRELCLARKITHKNVCRIHEFSRSNGMAYTSMEFVEGESLSSRLARARSLPVKEAVDIARQICAGLCEAHAQGIVHRDLKPANIMLDRSGTVKIMDFGIARMIQRDGPMTGTIVGTPAYMAPEQAELKQVSARTDIYALGLLLYEMITGAPAFEGHTPVAVALKQIREYPKRPREIVPELSRNLDAVVMKCLQKNAAKRFQSAAELDLALMKAAKAQCVSPWEATVNRQLLRAELEIQKALRLGAAQAKAFLKRQDWGSLTEIQGDPKAMLGVSGMVAALAVFLLFGAWKPRTINAQPVPDAKQIFASPGVPRDESLTSFTVPAARTSLGPIASNAVDLYGGSRTGSANAPSADPQMPAPGKAESPLARNPEAPSKPPRIVRAVKSPVRAGARQARINQQGSLQLQPLTGPAQPEVSAAAAAPISARLEPVEISVRPDTETPPAAELAKTATQPKETTETNKQPKFYVEVGAFKDESWAHDAVDKLAHLGFPALMIHKNLLWSQSFHVQVGPYPNQKDATEARQSLAAQGYKGRLVN